MDRLQQLSNSFFFLVSLVACGTRCSQAPDDLSANGKARFCALGEKTAFWGS
jgi:hypothetical protein